MSFYPRFILAHCAALALITLCLIEAACGSGEGLAKGTAGLKTPPPSVTTALVKVMTLPVMGDLIGQSSAKERVSIVPRVTGFLEQIYFKEGAEVHKGEALFQMGQASYRIAVESAQSKLAQDATQSCRVDSAGRIRARAVYHPGTFGCGAGSQRRDHGNAKHESGADSE